MALLGIGQPEDLPDAFRRPAEPFLTLPQGFFPSPSFCDVADHQARKRPFLRPPSAQRKFQRKLAGSGGQTPFLPVISLFASLGKRRSAASHHTRMCVSRSILTVHACPRKQPGGWRGEPCRNDEQSRSCLSTSPSYEACGPL